MLAYTVYSEAGGVGKTSLAANAAVAHLTGVTKTDDREKFLRQIRQISTSLSKIRDRDILEI